MLNDAKSSFQNIDVRVLRRSQIYLDQAFWNFPGGECWWCGGGSRSLACPKRVSNILLPPLKHGSLHSTSNFFIFTGDSLITDQIHSACQHTTFYNACLNQIPPSMSATCIVCLGDLGHGLSDHLVAAATFPKSPLQAGDTDLVTNASNHDSAQEDKNDNELIAHLKPCDHHLHNDCLTPWVERANSCPICRARFYTVELSKNVGGTNFPFLHLLGSLQLIKTF